MPWFFASFTRFALGSFVRLELHCPGIQHHHLLWQAFLLAKFFLQIFTKETCSMLSSMDLAEKVQRQFCFYFVPWHILIGQVKPRICQTGYIERTWLSRCGVWQLAKHHHSKTSRGPTCMSQVLLSRILEGRGPTLPWCWHFSSFFWNFANEKWEMGVTKMFCVEWCSSQTGCSISPLCSTAMTCGCLGNVLSSCIYRDL